MKQYFYPDNGKGYVTPEKKPLMCMSQFNGKVSRHKSEFYQHKFDKALSAWNESKQEVENAYWSEYYTDWVANIGGTSRVEAIEYLSEGQPVEIDNNLITKTY